MASILKRIRSVVTSPIKAIATAFRSGMAPVANTSNWLRGRYDSAQHTDENENHWGQADWLSANGSNSHSVRWLLRNRSRYECANNSYLKGLVSTLAHDLIGTGPRLQLTLPEALQGYTDQQTADAQSDRRSAAKRIEAKFTEWLRSVDGADKLRVMEETRNRDGEAFAVMITNPKLGDGNVKLDIKLLEADQVTTPSLVWTDPLQQDGILFDEWGNPTEYHVLKHHPGDLIWRANWEYDRVPAAQVLHWFRPVRPGQSRGIPETTAALPLCSQLRRYTLATIGAAELAAMIAGVMKTDNPAEGTPPQIEAMDRVEFQRNALLTLPAGWDATAFDAKQPVSGYKEFKGEVLNEIGRGMNVPFNTISGNSSAYNYSSARLDHLIYYRTLRVNRANMRLKILDRLFRAWLNEAIFLPGLLPDGLPPICEWRWEWHWDGFDSIDPSKDVSASADALAARLTTYAAEYAANGQDWEEAFRQIAREKALMAELGLTGSDVAAKPVAKPAAVQPQSTETVANAA